MAVAVNLPCYDENITVEHVERFIAGNVQRCVTIVCLVLSTVSAAAAVAVAAILYVHANHVMH